MFRILHRLAAQNGAPKIRYTYTNLPIRLFSTKTVASISQTQTLALLATATAGVGIYYYTQKRPIHTKQSPPVVTNQIYPPGSHPDLSQEEVDNILKVGESYLLFPKASGIERVDACAVASNNPIEDQHFEVKLGKDAALLGVLDGSYS